MFAYVCHPKSVAIEHGIYLEPPCRTETTTWLSLSDFVSSRRDAMFTEKGFKKTQKMVEVEVMLIIMDNHDSKIF